MAQIDPVDLATSIVRLRNAIVKTRDRSARSALREVEVTLRRALGPTIAKKKAAAVLGVSVTALDRWIERGFLPVVERPGSSRHELESRPFLELAREVERGRGDVRDVRAPIAAALERLGWRANATGKRVIRFDVAALPRPNISEHELRSRFCSTTAEERVREAAELSQLLVPSGHRREHAA